MAQQKYKVTFEIDVVVKSEEVNTVRTNNRNFLSTGFFAIDENLEQAIAYNKALDAVSTQSSLVTSKLTKMTAHDLSKEG